LSAVCLVPKSDIHFNPDITVACVIVREGRFLLVEESVRERRVLNQPAGHLEPGEGLLEAAAREALEETGWTVKLTHFIGSYLWRAETGKTYIRFAFAADAVSHDPGWALDAGIIRCVWLDIVELKAERERLRSPLVMTAIEDFLGGQRAPLSLIRHVDG
jgi:8-oxo-dGTP pyrophosphatase MutT (NUDIX family)